MTETYLIGQCGGSKNGNSHVPVAYCSRTCPMCALIIECRNQLERMCRQMDIKEVEEE